MFKIGMADTVGQRPEGVLQGHLWVCHLLKTLINQIKRLWQMTYSAKEVVRHFLKLNIQNFRYLKPSQLKELSKLYLFMKEKNRYLGLTSDGCHLLAMIKACFQAKAKFAFRESDRPTINKICAALNLGQLGAIRHFLIQDKPEELSVRYLMNEQMLINYRTVVALGDKEKSAEMAEEFCDAATNLEIPGGLLLIQGLTDGEQQEFLDRLGHQKLLEIFKRCLSLDESPLHARMLSFKNRVVEKVEVYLKEGVVGRVELQERIDKVMSALLTPVVILSFEQFHKIIPFLNCRNLLDMLGRLEDGCKMRLSIYRYMEEHRKEFSGELKEICDKFSLHGAVLFARTHEDQHTDTFLAEAAYLRAKQLFLQFYGSEEKSKEVSADVIRRCTSNELNAHGVVLTPRILNLLK